MYADRPARFAGLPAGAARLCLLILCSALGAWARADAEEAAKPSAARSVRFERIRLEPVGAPDLEIFDDLDGDGLKDILLCDNRVFSAFLCRRDTGFPAEPDFRLKAPEDAIFLDVGDVDGDGRREPLFLSRQGVSRLVLSGKEGYQYRLESVLPCEEPFLPPAVDRLVFLDFLKDMTGDGVEDLIVPGLSRVRIFRASKGGAFELWQEIPILPRSDFYTEELSETGRLKEVVHLPSLIEGGVGASRFFLLFDGTSVSAFERSEDGAFALQRAWSLYDADSRKYEEESRAYFGKNVFLEDLRGNGDALLVIADNRNGRMDFYPVRGDWESAKSELTLKTSGWLLKPLFKDLNGDGLQDLLLPSIEKIGLLTLVRIFFTSRFDIHYMIFFNRRKPLYGLLPDISRSVSLPLSFSMGPEGLNIKHSLIYTFDGDFDGDGLNDFLSRSAPDSLGICFGRPGAGFPEAPDRKLPFDALEECTAASTRVFDFNGDGISDIFIHQRSSTAGLDRYDVYYSVPAAALPDPGKGKTPGNM